MRNTIKLYCFSALFAGLFFTALFSTGCKKQYLVDGGTLDPHYKGTIWKYLNDKPANFDSLTRIINIAQMSDVFQKDTITFFAPSSSCIYKSVKALNAYLNNRGQDTVKQLTQINPTVWREMLSLYIIPGRYLLKDIPQLDTTNLASYSGQGFISYGGTPMNIGVIYNSAGTVKYAGYRQLWYSYINNFNNATGSMINVPVASSDIQPLNGVVHVLRYQNHNFGFKVSDFIVKAISAGISKPN